MNRCISTKVLASRTGSQRRLAGRSRASTAPPMISAAPRTLSPKNHEPGASIRLASSISTRATGVIRRQTLCEKKPTKAGLRRGDTRAGQSWISWKLPASVRILRRFSCAIEVEGRSYAMARLSKPAR